MGQEYLNDEESIPSVTRTTTIFDQKLYHVTVRDPLLLQTCPCRRFRFDGGGGGGGETEVVTEPGVVQAAN
jgi:hypothetical protein